MMPEENPVRMPPATPKAKLCKVPPMMRSVVELAKIKGVATLTVGDVSIADLPKEVKAMTSTVTVINKALVIYPAPIKEMGAAASMPAVAA